MNLLLSLNVVIITQFRCITRPYVKYFKCTFYYKNEINNAKVYCDKIYFAEKILVIIRYE